MVKHKVVGIVISVAAFGACNAETQPLPPAAPPEPGSALTPPWEVASASPRRMPRLPSVVAVPGHVGCFRDQGDPHGTSGRDLDGLVVDNRDMTIEMCKRLCADENFPYAATQYSTFCFCGSSYGRSGPADNCDMKCAGNPNQTCGGRWANSVYRVR